MAVAPDSGKVVQGFARGDLFTVVLEHFQTDTADYADYILPATRSWSTGTSTWPTARPMCCSTARPLRPVGQARSNAQIFRDLAARMGFDRPCFADSDEGLCRQAFGNAVDYAGCSNAGLCHAERARCALCRRPLPHALGPLRILQRPAGRRKAWMACPTTFPTTSGRAPAPATRWR